MTRPLGHRSWSLVALVLLTAVVAGCAGEPSEQGPSPISAREAFQTAQETVEAWNEGAELLAVSGFEGGEQSPAVQRQREQPENDQDAFQVRADSFPGDGRAPQWVMVFMAENQTRSILATGDEARWMDEGARGASPGAQTIDAWPIDSTDAVDRALEAEEGFDELLAARDVSVFLTLGSGSQGTQWRIQAQSHQEGEQALVLVHAETGEVNNRSQAQSNPRIERFEGTLDKQARNATHPIEIGANRARAAVELSWDGESAERGARLSAALFDGDHKLEPAETSQSASRFQARWDRLEPDAYDVEVRVDAFGEAGNVSYDLTVHID